MFFYVAQAGLELMCLKGVAETAGHVSTYFGILSYIFVQR